MTCLVILGFVKLSYVCAHLHAGCQHTAESAAKHAEVLHGRQGCQYTNTAMNARCVRTSEARCTIVPTCESRSETGQGPAGWPSRHQWVWRPSHHWRPRPAGSACCRHAPPLAVSATISHRVTMRACTIHDLAKYHDSCNNAQSNVTTSQYMHVSGPHKHVFYAHCASIAYARTNTL